MAMLLDLPLVVEVTMDVSSVALTTVEVLVWVVEGVEVLLVSVARHHPWARAWARRRWGRRRQGRGWKLGGRWMKQLQLQLRGLVDVRVEPP